MDRLRNWVLLAAVAAVVVLAGGWLLLVSPEKEKASALRDDVAGQEALNAQAQTRLEVLEDKAEGLPEQEAALVEAGTRVPEQVGLPDLIRALTAAARDTGVDLVSVTPGAPTALADAAAAGAAGTGAAPATPGATGTAPVAGDPATATTPGTATAPATGTVSSVPVVLQVTGTYYETEEFVAALEDLPRALRLTGLSLTPTKGSAGTAVPLSTSISGLVYVRGAAAAAAGGTAAGAAGGTPTAPGSVPAPAVTTAQPPAAAS